MIKIVKSELIDKTWKTINCNVQKNNVKEIIDTFINIIGNEIKQSTEVKIEGFGTFSLNYRKPYIGKSINDGLTQEIPESTYIRFVPSKQIKPK